MGSQSLNGIQQQDTLTAMEVIDYHAQGCRTYIVNDHHAIMQLAQIPDESVRWINIDGECSQQTLITLGEAFHIHPLVIKNMQDHSQRSKIEVYSGFLYIVARMIYFSGDELVVEHINFLLGEKFVITLGEVQGDVFDAIRDWIQSEGANVRNNGADYLLYLQLDAIVDGYFDVLETLNERIDELEEKVMAETSQEHLQAIREIKKSLLLINKCIWPLRDVASLMGKESTHLIKPATEPYLLDVHHHIVQAIDSTETSRELLSSLTDLHISNTSCKLNEIMKVLTIISTIFIPLTFIAGVYGMNFHYMPELAWPIGYGIVWLVMLIIAGCMFLYFKKKKWF